MADELPLTITVPEAGKRYFSMSRGASYAAAERGEIPTGADRSPFAGPGQGDGCSA